MRATELVDRSASAALQRAASIQVRLRDAGADGLGECRDELHELVADIVSLRNAAELLMRQLPAG